MQGLILPNRTVRSATVDWRWRRHRCAYAVILLCLLGTLAFGAYCLLRHDYNVLQWYSKAGGWIETAGVEASSWPLAPGDPGDPGMPPPAPGPFRYLINEEDKCPEGGEGEQPFLVLLIPSEPHQNHTRDAIRQTWGTERPLGAAGPRVLRLFLLGTTEEEEDEDEAEDPRSARRSLLEEESRRHGDILQQDFKDTYRNLTLKTLMGLNWVARHCPGAAYVMKADTDVFVNTEYLVHEVLGWRRPGAKPRRSLITGLNRKAALPVRDKRRKWYVSEEEYPGETYPEYCDGWAYLLSSDLAGRIYTASLGIPHFLWEDVYVGMCLERLGVAITPPPSSYERLVNAHHAVLAVHRTTPAQMLDYWHRLRETSGYY